MILITGANGNLGSLTIEYLLKNNPDEKIAGLVRCEEKGNELKEKGIELRIGDYLNKDSLHEAMKGIKRLVLISSSNLENRVTQHKNVIEAANNAGVEQIFYTSIVEADKLLGPLSDDHNETENAIKDSGISYTILRNTFYLEFLPIFLGNALETGNWNFPSGGNKINLALREEMAEALAKTLENPQTHLNKVYEITSNSGYTLQEIAEMMESEVGTKVDYQDVTVKEYTKQLEEAGLPQDAIMMSFGVATTFVNGGLDYSYNDLEQLLGREPVDIKQYIQESMA